MPDKERIQVRLIVALQNVEVLGHQEGWSLSACRHQKVGGGSTAAAAAVGRLNTKLVPLTGCPTLPRPFERTGDLGWNHNLHAPAAFRLPTMLPQIVCNRRQGIGSRMSYVAHPVSIPIDRITEKVRGEKLRLAHGSGPT